MPASMCLPSRCSVSSRSITSQTETLHLDRLCHKLHNPALNVLWSLKLEQNLAAAIRFQGLLERFLEQVERVHMLHRGGERSISHEISQLLINLFDLCSRRVAYPIDEPESVEVKTPVDELFGRHSRELPTLHAA